MNQVIFLCSDINWCLSMVRIWEKYSAVCTAIGLNQYVHVIIVINLQCVIREHSRLECIGLVFFFFVQINYWNFVNNNCVNLFFFHFHDGGCCCWFLSRQHAQCMFIIIIESVPNIFFFKFYEGKMSRIWDTRTKPDLMNTYFDSCYVRAVSCSRYIYRSMAGK